MKVYSIITDVIEQETDADRLDDDVCIELDNNIDKMLRDPKNCFGKRHYLSPNSAVIPTGGLEYDGYLDGLFHDIKSKAVDSETMDRYLDDEWYSILVRNYSLENMMEILPEKIQSDIGEWFKEYLFHVAHHEGIEVYDKEE